MMWGGIEHGLKISNTKPQKIKIWNFPKAQEVEH